MIACYHHRRKPTWARRVSLALVLAALVIGLLSCAGPSFTPSPGSAAPPPSSPPRESGVVLYALDALALRVALLAHRARVEASSACANACDVYGVESVTVHECRCNPRPSLGVHRVAR
jgi:hypothetical protein